jgi:hypothetical protein
MEQIRLIYVSKLTEDCDMDALQEILKVSRKNNAESGITGILCYDPAFFLQCLEGPREAVHALYQTIEQDSRHQNVVRIEDTEAPERLFGKWTMAFVKASELDKRIIEVYGPHGKFDPYDFNATTAREFLVAIAQAKGQELNAQADPAP